MSAMAEGIMKAMELKSENERLHTLHLQRTKLTTKVIKERDEAQDEVKRLTAEVSKLQAGIQAVLNEVAVVAGIDALEKVTKAALDTVSGSPKPIHKSIDHMAGSMTADILRVGDDPDVALEAEKLLGEHNE